MPETLDTKEHFEKREQPSSRIVEIYIVRHGKQEKLDDPHSILSKEGEEQAKKFAEGLLKTYANQDVVIKVKKSLVQRASKTADVITETIENKIKGEQLINIKLLKTREAENLKTTGALGPIMAKGIDYSKSVDEWLNNADKYDDAKKPEEVVNQIEKMIDEGDKLAKKISAEGPKIVYIWVTHETAHAALMKEITGKNTEELGGGIGHLESIKVTTSSDPEVEPIINFRGKEYKLSNQEK